MKEQLKKLQEIQNKSTDEKLKKSIDEKISALKSDKPIKK